MLQITSRHKILLCLPAVDFRKGLDALLSLCKPLADPFSGTVFVFRNRIGTSVKLIVYDGNGFWLCQKRFSEGKLKWWPTSVANALSLRSTELSILLAQGKPLEADIPEEWRKT